MLLFAVDKQERGFQRDKKNICHKSVDINVSLTMLKRDLMRHRDIKTTIVHYKAKMPTLEAVHAEQAIVPIKNFTQTSPIVEYKSG